MTKDQTERVLSLLERIAVALEGSNIGYFDQPHKELSMAEVMTASAVSGPDEPAPDVALGNSERPLSAAELEQLVAWTSDVVGWLDAHDRDGTGTLARILGEFNLADLPSIGDDRALARAVGERLHAETMSS